MKRNTHTKILSEKPHLAGDEEVEEILSELDEVEVIARLIDTPEGEAISKYHTKRIVDHILDILELASKHDVEKLLFTIAKLDAEMSMAKYLNNARSQEQSLYKALDELLKSK